MLEARMCSRTLQRMQVMEIGLRLTTLLKLGHDISLHSFRWELPNLWGPINDDFDDGNLFMELSQQMGFQPIWSRWDALPGLRFFKSLSSPFIEMSISGILL